MRWFFWIVFLIIGMFFGVEIAKDPGYALFVYHDWSVQMPLWLFVVSIFLALFFVYLMTRLFYRLVFIKYWIKCWWLKKLLREKDKKN